ncbi:Beta-methylmalyl-CoA dehydratase [Austwickia sp. TVS 96-490-7B]|uniref:MaoC family dehydratase n=1 Tax=Austwickia sp. TVS 96-490-7B TaxID=2830843 RepID=UPI001C590309|nr:MaoC family dehydratase [Austwickia sp. TVS 96-490-7B]MBW3086632.1 Beta-methylmalyl-CoA dehydratase [Austwickia sp. TVS 96-490-7B]
MSPKALSGNYFEDFEVGQRIRHSTPRTVTDGDVALYQALYGSRFAVTSAATFAASCGQDRMPLDSLLVFHIVFGKTVPDISLNAVANLGYARGVFGVPVYPGDTLSAHSVIEGLKENSSQRTGVVYVHTLGENQHGELVLDYHRWVMVNKRHPASLTPDPVIPDLPKVVPIDVLHVPWQIRPDAYDILLAGSPYLWDDYDIGERIDHVDGTTIEEAEHMMATRLYQNTAKVHFNQHAEGQGRHGRRIVYGGNIMSVARALSFNGLGNALSVAAINGGTHTAPTFAGHTVYAWTHVLDRMALPGRDDIGALRLRTVATKDRPCHDYPYQDDHGKYLPDVTLDLDYTVLIPRRRTGPRSS